MYKLYSTNVYLIQESHCGASCSNTRSCGSTCELECVSAWQSHNISNEQICELLYTFDRMQHYAKLDVKLISMKVPIINLHIQLFLTNISFFRCAFQQALYPKFLPSETERGRGGRIWCHICLCLSRSAWERPINFSLQSKRHGCWKDILHSTSKLITRKLLLICSLRLFLLQASLSDVLDLHYFGCKNLEISLAVINGKTSSSFSTSNPTLVGGGV